MSEFYKLTPEYQKDKPWWKIAECYFKENLLTEHQIDSYNIFMREKLPDIIIRHSFVYTNKDGISYEIKFSNIYVSSPKFSKQTENNNISKQLTPQECRMRNLNYMCEIYADIHQIDIVNKTSNIFEKSYLGSIPCMVLSDFCNLAGKTQEEKIRHGECRYDPGGYFIINGTEKVLMSQDRMAHNEIFVFKCKEKDSIRLPISGSDKNQSVSMAWSAEVRSYSREKEPNITTTYLRLSEKQLQKGEESRLYVELHGFKAPIPWPIVFLAYNMTDKKDIIKCVCDETDTEMIDLLKPSLGTSGITTQQEAIEFLTGYLNSGQKKDTAIESVKFYLREKVFQNINSVKMKCYYLGNMTNQLLSTVLGRKSQDDRDHYGKKRIDTAGALINNLFKSIWKRITKEVAGSLSKKKRNNEIPQLFYDKITSCIKSPFATGNWSATKFSVKSTKAGISQILNRYNFIATVSNLRRVITPNDKNSKIIRPRHLHNSQWGYICPVETPEGQSAGLIKNLALLTKISDSTFDITIITLLKSFDYVISVDENNVDSLTLDSEDVKIFINDSWCGYTREPERLLRELKLKRRVNRIDRSVSISRSEKGIKMYNDEGRVLAPFLIVENGKLKDIPDDNFTWQELIDKHIIEYLDPAELETIYHSVYPWKIEPNSTHCFIHPSLIMGISACTAPFPEHNQSPRNIYQAAMGKQALGVFSLNYKLRFDTNSHILCYPQIPLVNTHIMREVGSHLPSGQNAIVAVMSAAYNQEDSVIINRQSLDNGFLRSFCYTTYSESGHRKGNTIYEIRKPDKENVRETRLTGYSKLDEDGISSANVPLAKRDVVVGKVQKSSAKVQGTSELIPGMVKKTQGPPMVIKDASVLVKINGMTEDSVVEIDEDDEKIYKVYPGSAIVDKAIVTLNADSYRTVKVRTRQLRRPQTGDKVASRSAQKGIIGMVVPPEDLPVSETGIIPDLLMNPNAFPSRMTMGQALETLLGKACALRGDMGDCTAFEEEFNLETVEEELKKYGFDHHGDEVFYNGLTGEEMPCKLFVGPTYYQRLKHMVDDKIHARDQDGPRETLTRQPVEGRKRQGGFRMGEMETWCGISYGASNFLIDRLVNNSDKYEMYVCDHCGNTAIACVESSQFKCKFCDQSTDISKICLPYAFKLLKQELQTCGIGIWPIVEK